MSDSYTVRRRPDRLIKWTDDHDWLAEFATEPATESASEPGLLTGARTLPVITRSTSPSVPRTRRTHQNKWTWPYRSMLLIACALVLLALSGTLMATFWMRAALAPVPVAEWPVPSSRVSAHTAPAAVMPTAPALPSESATTVTQQPAVATPTPAPNDRPAHVAVPAPAPVSTGNDVSDILTVLERYRLALGSLNPASVRAVVPTVDMRALAHEFADIKRQTLAFDDCKIDVQGSQAQAACGGRVSVVPKSNSGSNGAVIQSRRWTFTLVHAGRSWAIQSVAAR